MILLLGIEMMLQEKLFISKFSFQGKRKFMKEILDL